jgi:hypothetical protein
MVRLNAHQGGETRVFQFYYAQSSQGRTQIKEAPRFLKRQRLRGELWASASTVVSVGRNRQEKVNKFKIIEEVQ